MAVKKKTTQAPEKKTARKTRSVSQLRKEMLTLADIVKYNTKGETRRLLTAQIKIVNAEIREANATLKEATKNVTRATDAWV